MNTPDHNKNQGYIPQGFSRQPRSPIGAWEPHDPQPSGQSSARDEFNLPFKAAARQPSWRLAMPSVFRFMMAGAVICLIIVSAYPFVTGITGNMKSSADRTSLVTLNSLTRKYMSTSASGDQFGRAPTDEARMSMLVSAGLLGSPMAPAREGASFTWSDTESAWAYMVESASYASTVDIDFRSGDLDLSRYAKSSDFRGNKDQSGLVSDRGAIFFDNRNTEYTITARSKTASSGLLKGGYAILFESSITDNSKDTGYCLMFDERSGNVSVRQRLNGKTKGSALAIATRYGNPSVIPDSTDSPWWNEPHEIRLHVSKVITEPGSKILEVWVDGSRLDMEFKFKSDLAPMNSFTGISTWSSSTTCESLKVTGSL